LEFSEQDVNYVISQIGVTTLGLVGETTQGPAFQPIFITNYGNFSQFFGGLDNEIIPDNLAPRYELAYIAKSYLSQSNQLFVTRVLGFSGYHAGLSWVITLDGALNPATVATTGGGSSANLISYTATSAGTVVTLVSTDPLTQQLINNGSITTNLAFLGNATTGTTASISPTYIKNAPNFTGVSINLVVTTKGTSGSNITGTTSGNTTYYSGTSYTEVENTVVALLRSRGVVNPITQINAFQITGSTGLIMDPSVTGVTTNPLAYFSLSGNSTSLGLFDYSVSFDNTQKNFLTTVLGTDVLDGKTAVFVEEFFYTMFTQLNNQGMVRGLKTTLINYNTSFDNYVQQYQPAVTPYLVSELRGNKVLRLFRFWTIADGNSANENIKISITNIQPDELLFNVQIRAYNDTDANPVILESFANCSMDPASGNNYIARKIGTIDGNYPSQSAYVMVDLDNGNDTSDAFPAGFIGYTYRDYTLNGNTNNTQPPYISYVTSYPLYSNVNKQYLGLSDTIGIDQDFFYYQGIPENPLTNIWTGLTPGFHMDVNASAATIDDVSIVINATGGTYHPTFFFETGVAPFQTDAQVETGPYSNIKSRKFTFAPAGGFDGWDIYRTARTNIDQYIINGEYSVAGLTSGAFANRTLSSGDAGTTADYYAFNEAIWTFQNPQAVSINVLATPGIDTFENQNLVNVAIDMVEELRQDCCYIVTTPDVDSSGTLYDIQDDVVDNLDGNFDSNYTATYWPWVQINDTENNVYIWVPSTRDVVTNLALTDNIAFPWYATAGVNRGVVNAIQARTKLTQSDRDLLYQNRVNPIATFSSEGIIIWGNLTMQVADTALNRLNIRRLLLQAQRLIAAVSLTLLFEPNDTTVRNQFLSLVNPILNNIRSERGLIDFRVQLDTDTSAANLDTNQMTGTIILQPTRALENIGLTFSIDETGASFATS
jgi:hypothetical protein